MAYATERSAYGAAYLEALLGRRTSWSSTVGAGEAEGTRAALAGEAGPAPLVATTVGVAAITGGLRGLPAGPRQEEIDRQLSLYEAYVWASWSTEGSAASGGGEPVGAGAATAPQPVRREGWS
jgi:hypothetical protein